MKNKNKTDHIVEYMTWSSPMNQAFIIEALSRDNIEFTYQGNETNVTKVKQAIKLFGADRIQKALKTYAIAIVNSKDELKESMKDSFISADAWIQSAIEALTTIETLEQKAA